MAYGNTWAACSEATERRDPDARVCHPGCRRHQGHRQGALEARMAEDIRTQVDALYATGRFWPD
jgi:hypothetical protein